MELLWQKITEWLKQVLISGITDNLTGMFDATNQKVAEISAQVGTTPQAWNGSIYNMMKRILTTMTLAAMMSVASLAQSSVVSAGGEATGDGTVSFSVGQTAYMTAANENGSLSQGVQQAYVITEETGIEITQIQLRAFPNPTSEYVTVQSEQPVEHLALFDLNGRLVKRVNVGGETESRLDMNDVPSGFYLMQVIFGNQQVQNLKIIKR